MRDCILWVPVPRDCIHIREKVRFLLSNGFRKTSKGNWIANGLDTEGESDDDETDKEASTDGD